MSAAAAASMPCMVLNTGARIPQLGFGTWNIDKTKVGAAVKAALDAGYRHLDLAYIYENQAAVGQALQEWLAENKNVARADIFVTSKLWCTEFRPERVEPALRATLADLRLDYLDLYLMHWPAAFEPCDDPFRAPGKADPQAPKLTDTWCAMEAVHALGLAKAIGVSNWNARSLYHLVRHRAASKGGVCPAVNQIELHPLLPQHGLVAACKGMNVVPVAYSPLGSQSSPLLHDSEVARISQKHNCTAAQVVLSWGVRRGTAVIPRSATASRIRENAKCTVPLDAEDMKMLDTLVSVHGRQALRVCDPIKFWGMDMVSEHVLLE